MQKSIETFFQTRRRRIQIIFHFFPFLKEQSGMGSKSTSEKKVVKVINFLSVNIEHTEKKWWRENFSYFFKEICSFSMA